MGGPSDQTPPRDTTNSTVVTWSVENRTDEELIIAYREGDAAAIGALITRYQGELTGFLMRKMGNRSGAEDVFQETFLQVHQSLSRFDESRRFRPWLFKIAVNKSRDWYRRNSRRLGMTTLSTPIGGAASGNSNSDGARIVDFLAAQQDLPEGDLETAEMRDRIRSVIDPMPDHLKEILLLAYFQRFSYDEIASTLEIPLGTVKSRLHSAVANFGDRWKRANRIPSSDDSE